ncbi:O181 family O-antigen polymerase, partial [Escherichia coli]|nr:O181 family O-antigen polymerase [Escherichia coli]
TSFNYYKITTGLYIILTMYSLLVSIYLSIPLLLYGIITNKKGTPLFIALFFSILGYSFTPPFEFDLYRHYESYEYYLQYNEFLYPIKDFYLSFLFLIGKNLSLKKEFLYFISILIYYTSILTVVLKLKKNVPLTGTYFFIIFVLFILNNTVVEITGLRFTTALGFISLFIYYNYIESRKKTSYFFLFLSVLSHFSVIILPIVIILLRLLYKLFNSRLNAIIMIFTSVIAGLYFVEPIVAFAVIGVEKLFNIYIGAETYTSGLWGADRVTLHGFSQTGIMFENIKLGISILIPVIISITFILNKDYGKNELTKLFVACSIIFFIFIPFDTVYLRYQYLLIVTALIIFATKNYKFKYLDGQFIGISMIFL